MANIRPEDLPPVSGSVDAASAIIIDDGDGVWKATPAGIVASGAPAVFGVDGGAALVGLAQGRAVQNAVDELLGNIVSLKRFELAGEPIGTGNAAYDHGALTRACDYLMDERRAVPLIVTGFTFPTTTIFLPPGDYRSTGGLGADLECLGFWCFPGTVTITNTADAYLFVIPNRLDFTYLSGIRFIGGKGALRHSYTGVNTSHEHIVEYNVFLDYTECAVSSDASNMPYWRVRWNEFWGKVASGTLTKGLAIGGLNDSSVIQQNAFRNNDIHCQLGPFLSGSLHTLNNDFISNEANRTDVDLWLIPNDTVGAYGTNSGQGSRIQGNKFGNENITDIAKKAPRVLVAAKTGANLATCTPDLTWKDGANGANWLTGLIFTGNRLVTANLGGTGGADASAFDIYVEKMDRIIYADNPVSGGRFNYLFRHVDAGARNPDKDNTNWKVTLGGTRGNASPVKLGVSSSPVGLIDDPDGVAPGPFTRLPRGLTDPVAASIVSIEDHSDWTAEAGVTVTGVTDRTAGTTAAQIVFPSTSAGVNIGLGSLTAHQNKAGQIGFVVKVPAADAVPELRFELAMYDGAAVRYQLYQTIPVPQSENWEVMPLTFTLPDDADSGTLYIRAPSRTASANTVIIEHGAVGSGRTPLAIPA
jgi:hypothetical protein